MAAWFCARARRVGGIVFVEQASCGRRSAAIQLQIWNRRQRQQNSADNF